MCHYPYRSSPYSPFYKSSFQIYRLNVSFTFSLDPMEDLLNDPTEPIRTKFEPKSQLHYENSNRRFEKRSGSVKLNINLT